jgi:hypothetical protein
VWLEARPPGAPLNHIAALLEPAHVALVLLDCCEGLVALHDAGRVHGDVKSKRVVLGEGGYTTLVGVGQRHAHPEEDLAALIRLGRTLCGERGGLRLPEVAPASAGALQEQLEEQLEELDQDTLRDDLAAICDRERATIPEEPTMLQVVVEHIQGTRGRVDELLPILGPETERTGSQISWSSSVGEVTRESSAEHTQGDIEGTGSLHIRSDHLGRRTQVFARILAPLDQLASTARLPSTADEPCAAVRKLVLEGPMDPLAFAGAMPGSLPPAAVRGSIPRDVSVTQVFRARNTQVGEAPAPTPRKRSWGPGVFLLVLLAAAFAVGMVAGSALLYFYGL